MKILNVCAGKKMPINNEILLDKSNSILNVDKCYKGYVSKNLNDDLTIQKVNERFRMPNWSGVFYMAEDIYMFLNHCLIRFDYVCMYRYFEHINLADIPYFVYLLSSVMKKNSILDIVVPDFEKLSMMLIDMQQEKFNPKTFNLIQSEFFAEPFDPHRFITTEQSVSYYLEFEDNFTIEHVTHDFSFDGRDIYLRIKARRRK